MTSTPYNKIEHETMARVYGTWFFRSIVGTLVPKVLVAVVLLVQFRNYASVKHVLANSPSFFDFQEAVWFFISAISGAEIQANLLMLGFLVLGIWLLRDAVHRVEEDARASAVALFLR